MRKISSFALSAAALGALGWMATAQAQPAPEGTPAPSGSPTASMAAPAPEAAPAPTPAPDAAAPAPDASGTPAPAPDAGPKAKPMKHHHMKSASMHHKAEGGDAAVEDLNAKSLSAAKDGKSFAPPTDMGKTSSSKPAKSMMHRHHKHVVHHAAAASPDASPAPAPDASPAPADAPK